MIKRVVVGAGMAAVGWAAYSGARSWWETWGIVDDEANRPLPGDDLVADAMSSDTRGVTIEAPPELVWPWLVQMGYGRGGWYSIDRLDMRGGSADRIVDEWQTLAEGDTIPTHPGGGFTVRALDPGRSLVLYADATTMQPEAGVDQSDVPVGLAASGAFLSATPSEFRASWTFVLVPVGASRTRLIERVRYWGTGGSPLARPALALLGFGVFVMMQRQMVGIRDRAERLAAERRIAPATPPMPAPEPNGNGHAPDLPSPVLATTTHPA